MLLPTSITQGLVEHDTLGVANILVQVTKWYTTKQKTVESQIEFFIINWLFELQM